MAVFFVVPRKGEWMSREKVSGIYIIKNMVNGKVYIGQSVDIQKRFLEHKWELKNNKHRNSYMQRSWEKYGEDNFLFEIIERYPSHLLNEKETYWIKNYKSNNSVYGYNCNDGGDSRIPNEITREKHRVANLGKKRSPETCALISEIHKGKKMSDESKLKMRNAKLGKKLTKEHKQKMSESLKGRKRSQETIKKVADANRGQKRSPEIVAKMTGRKASKETREKQSKVRIGKEPWNKGKTDVYSEETLEKMRKRNMSDELKSKLSEINRGRNGENIGNSILKEYQILEMMKLFEDKTVTRKEIAEKYGVALSTIKDIKSGKRWSHITGYKTKNERGDKLNVYYE